MGDERLLLSIAVLLVFGGQLGGVIGTSVLGTIIVAGVSAHFADHLAALGVPAERRRAS